MWFPDSQRILFAGTAPNQGPRLYVQDIASNKVDAISPEGINDLAFALSPDGRFAAAAGPDQKGYLFPTTPGESKLIAGLETGEVPVGWSADGHSLYIYRGGDLPAKVYLLDLATGHRNLWHQLMPPDPAGVEYVGPVLPAANGKSYAYGYRRLLSDLYLVEGLR